jgi:hypothetical protein
MFLGLILSVTMFFHDFHFTFTVLDYATEEKIVKCSQKVFYDDLEMAISKHLGQDIRLDTIINTPGDSILNIYFDQVFKLKAKKEMRAKWVGSEMQGSDLVWLYAEYDAKKLPKELTVSSNLFTELYDDQANIILLKNMDYDEDRLHFDNTEQSTKLIRN